MSDLAKLLAEKQKENMKIVAPSVKKSSAHLNAQDCDSETENIFLARTSTPVKTNTAASKTIPKNSRNKCFSFSSNFESCIVILQNVSMQGP